MNQQEQEHFPPGEALLRAVRAGFTLQGTSLYAWCRDVGIPPSNARTALIGSWNGPKGRALRARIVSAAKLAEGDQ